METAIVAGGCFWCTEAIFKRLIGVQRVEAGFMGGNLANPSYKEVCQGNTHHAEVVRITYDPALLSYDDILDVFWQAHDPTTLNRQGEDIGEQYRSAIFYLSEEQHQKALASKKASEASALWKGTYVTEILPAGAFFLAEDYHQNYYENNTDRGYCIFAIAPKINKIHDLFADKIKNQYQNLENENRAQKTI